MSETIRIIAGGLVEHELPALVLEHSIRRRTDSEVEFIFDPQWKDKIAYTEPTKRKPATSFSYQRFAIPEMCGYHGKAIYLDSDMIVKDDIKNLWDIDPGPTGATAVPGWQTAVMVIDCAVSDWRAGEIASRVDSGEFKTNRVMKCAELTGPVGRTIPEEWNVADRDNPSDDLVARASLLHFTNMATQPWLKKGHAWESQWLFELSDALRAGSIRPEDVAEALDNQFVRPSLGVMIGHADFPDDGFVFPNDRR